MKKNLKTNKKCGTCKGTKDYADFYNSAVGSRCIDCDRLKNRIYRLDRRGLTIDLYNQILAFQVGGCDICGQVGTETSPLVVDHDHGRGCHGPGLFSCQATRDSNGVMTPGCNRGILCSPCNTSLGARQDAAVDRALAGTSLKEDAVLFAYLVGNAGFKNVISSQVPEAVKRRINLTASVGAIMAASVLALTGCASGAVMTPAQNLPKMTANTSVAPESTISKYDGGTMPEGQAYSFNNQNPNTKGMSQQDFGQGFIVR